MSELLKNKKFRVLSLVYLSVLMAFFVTSHLDVVKDWVSKLNDIVSPVVLGLILSYFLNPILRFVEDHIFHRIRNTSARRGISLFVTMVIFFALIGLILWAVIPQLLESIQVFSANLTDYLRVAIDKINGIIHDINKIITPKNPRGPFELLSYDELSEKVTNFIAGLDTSTVFSLFGSDGIGGIVSTLSSTVSFFTDFLFGIFIVIYLLSTKERRYAQIHRFRMAFFSKEADQKIKNMVDVANRNFGMYIENKIVDILIFDLICYVFYTIFSVPYAILLATVLSFSNIVPLIGPIFGTFLTCILSILTGETNFWVATLLTVILQLLNSYVISPRFVRKNNGIGFLGSLVVILVMWNLFGAVGLLIGIPLYATIMQLFEAKIPLSEKKTERSYLEKIKDKIKVMQEASGTRSLKPAEKLLLESWQMMQRNHFISETPEDIFGKMQEELQTELAEENNNIAMNENKEAKEENNEQQGNQ